MAGGLRDVLAVQGVFPVSKPSRPGLTLLQLSGVWITGAVSGAPVTPAGLSIGQLSGVWIDGAPEVAPATPAGSISWMQMSGVWIDGAPEAPPAGGSSKQPHGAYIKQPGDQKQLKIDRRKMAALAILAIQEYYYD